MYLDGLSFLDDEREAWRPFEALADLPDDVAERPVDGAHGWSARDLMTHLATWLDLTLRGAKELAVGEDSGTFRQADADWEAGGDAMNDDLAASWATLPLDEVRSRFRALPGELRGYLTVVPEARWLKHPTNFEWIADATVDHYADHEADLRAILEAARA